MADMEMSYKKINRIRQQTERHPETAVLRNDLVFNNAASKPKSNVFVFDAEECIYDSDSYLVLDTTDPEIGLLYLPIEYCQRVNSKTGSYRAVIMPDKDYTCLTSGGKLRRYKGIEISSILMQRRILENERRKKIIQAESRIRRPQ